MAKCSKCKWAVWDELGGTGGECRPTGHKFSAAMQVTDKKLDDFIHRRRMPPRGYNAPTEFTYRMVSISWTQDKDCDAYEDKV